MLKTVSLSKYFCLGYFRLSEMHRYTDPGSGCRSAPGLSQYLITFPSKLPLKRPPRSELCPCVSADPYPDPVRRKGVTWEAVRLLSHGSCLQAGHTGGGGVLERSLCIEWRPAVFFHVAPRPPPPLQTQQAEELLSPQASYGNPCYKSQGESAAPAFAFYLTNCCVSVSSCSYW